MILRFWERVLELSLERPWRVLLAASAVVALLGVLIFLRLDLRSDIAGVVPTASERVLSRIDRTFGAGRRAYLLITDPRGEEERLVRFAEALSAALSRNPAIESVEYGYGEAASKLLGELALPYGPLFAPPEELGELERKLSPEGIRRSVEKLATRLRLPGLTPREELLRVDPLEMQTYLLARFDAFRGGLRFHPASPNALSSDGRSLLVTITGRSPLSDLAGAKSAARAILENARSILTAPWAAGLEVDASGGYFLTAETEAVIRRDITLSMATSIALVVLLSAASLGRILPVALGVTVLLGGTVVGLGLTTLLVGRLEALALGAGAILIGAGIDFVVHLLSSVLRLQSRGEPLQGALKSAVRETEPGMRFAALTTIAAFLTFLLARQDFLKQMGLFAALGIFASYVAALSVYPAALFLLLRREARPPPAPGALGFGGAVKLALERPRAVLWGSLVLTVISVLSIARWPPGLETDLRRLHARESPAIRAQEKMREAFGSAAEPIVLLIERSSEAEAVEAARRLAAPLEELRERGKIAGWISIAQVLPSAGDQEGAIRVLERKEGAALAANLREALEGEGFDPEAFRDAIERLGRIDAVRSPLTAARLREASLGKWVDSLLSAERGLALALVVVHPPLDLWTDPQRAAAVEAVEEAARRARVQVEMASLYTVSAESAREVTADFLRISLAAAGAVALLVAVQFRRIGWALVVLMPLSLGCLWMASAFALLGFRLNFMNITILPMILGMGVDSGIHITGRFLATGRDARATVHSTLVGVVLSATTTMAGFGSLALSRNQGLASVGMVSLIGMGSCLAASLLALPAALRLIEERGK